MCSGLPEILSRYDGLVDWELRDRSAMSVDLAPLRDLLNHLNNPQKQFRTIHIAGTKGKGSVGALIEAGLDRAAAASAEIRALQARMNPHFLFNALNALAALSRIAPREV